ncbi:MAG: indolepyruvate oxidoreductase subunit beta family protein [Alphaproteobacteria bacterium]|nr:indolepyruvate oxidoreductase subunit beta family protein [Alphaproteobacteria bacterium]
MDALTAVDRASSAGALPTRPITILVAALGGEGGGVLAEWLVASATDQGFPVQSTSIPGVAQRTGATTYYLEIYPAAWERLGQRAPVLALTPSPGNIDVMIASELLEAGRALQSGYVSPDRTTLVASSHRIYAIAEKSAMSDGRFDTSKLMETARVLARRLVLFDMARLAREAGTVINAVMFGALVGSGALPMSRQACEEAIRRSGKGAEASLRGFEAGYRHAQGDDVPAPQQADDRTRSRPVDRVRSQFPSETHKILEEGVARLADYQDEAYAQLYLDRLAPVLSAERDGGGGATGYRLTTETGRHLALWMSYEDVIRVADLKTRPERFARVRNEVRARPGEPVIVTEFLKPGIEELCAILPPSLARPLLAWAARRGRSYSIGMHVRTSTVTGYLLMRLLARMTGLRRKSSRFHDEQALIERWLVAVKAAAAESIDLALEIAECARLIKGYGDTHRRGTTNFLNIFDALIGPAAGRPAGRAAAIARARQAALADPEGKSLAEALPRPAGSA